MNANQAKVILGVAGFSHIQTGNAFDHITASRDLPESGVMVVISTVMSIRHPGKIVWASICSYAREAISSFEPSEPIRRVRLDDPTFETIILEALKAVAHDYSELALPA